MARTLRGLTFTHWLPITMEPEPIDPRFIDDYRAAGESTDALAATVDAIGPIRRNAYQSPEAARMRAR